MIVQWPGLIDIHVHLREPGATHKEDFLTGSSAAIAGGFTYILDMPNNPIPTFSMEALEQKVSLSREKARCDIGFHYGTDGNNLDTFPRAWNHPAVFGLKIYCNETTGKYMVTEEELLDRIFAAWRSSKPILVHAEGNMLPKTLFLARTYQRRVHVCHVATAEDVRIIRKEKAIYDQITCGVCPHHLFLTNDDESRLDGFFRVKPPIGDQSDQDALWEGIHDGTIDIVESDHAPHTKDEKTAQEPAYGMPGLETTLGLLLRAVHEKRLSMELAQALLYDRPKRIFSVPDQQDTYITCDPDEPYRIGEDGYHTKCQWSPFDGWEAYGKVRLVVFRGRPIYQDGRFLV